jgi:hypothetical protein
MRATATAVVCLLLGACAGGGPETLVADACIKEADQRLAGKTYEIDAGKLLASAAATDAPNMFQVTAPVIFDRGLASEFTQTLKCRARIDGKAASVISIEFIWSMEDLKKAE